MQEIKVGIIGAGGIAGGKHLPGHRNVEGRLNNRCLRY